MGTSGGGMSDEVRADLNPEGEQAPLDEQQPSVERPSASASKADWVDYVVSLGADRAFVTGSSKHFTPDDQDYRESSGLTKDDLVELAERLGG